MSTTHPTPEQSEALHQIADDLRHLADRVDALAYPGTMAGPIPVASDEVEAALQAAEAAGPEPIDAHADEHRCTACRATLATCDARLVGPRKAACCATCRLTATHGQDLTVDHERMLALIPHPSPEAV